MANQTFYLLYLERERETVNVMVPRCEHYTRKKIWRGYIPGSQYYLTRSTHSLIKSESSTQSSYVRRQTPPRAPLPLDTHRELKKKKNSVYHSSRGGRERNVILSPSQPRSQAMGRGLASNSSQKTLITVNLYPVIKDLAMSMSYQSSVRESSSYIIATSGPVPGAATRGSTSKPHSLAYFTDIYVAIYHLHRVVGVSWRLLTGVRGTQTCNYFLQWWIFFFT